MKIIDITMLRDDRGAPHGHTVVDYPKGSKHSVPEDLADAFIGAKSAELTKAEPAEKSPPAATWPPSDEQIANMKFDDMGELLKTKDVDPVPLKSKEQRVAAIRDLIKAEAANN